MKSSIWFESFILQVQTTKEVSKPEKASLGKEDVEVLFSIHTHSIMVFIYHIYLENCTPVANLKNAWQEQLGKTFSFSDF